VHGVLASLAVLISGAGRWRKCRGAESRRVPYTHRLALRSVLASLVSRLGDLLMTEVGGGVTAATGGAGVGGTYVGAGGVVGVGVAGAVPTLLLLL